MNTLATMHKSPIIPIKTYAPAIGVTKVTELPTAEARAKALELKNEALLTELATAKDRLRRLREVVESEIIYWERGLQSGEWDGIDAVKRRLSRLKGALLYPGLAGFGREEEL